MNIDLIRDELHSALVSTPYSRAIRNIQTEDTEITTFLHLLDDIVDEQYLHSPKDIPYSHAAHYKANPGYDEQLVQIARWNIDQLYQAKIHDYLWIVEHQIEFAKTALTQYAQYIRTAQKSRELFAALYRTIDLTRRVNGKAASMVDVSELWQLMYTQCDPSERRNLLGLALDYQLRDTDEIARLIETELLGLSDYDKEVNLVKALADLFEKACPFKKASKQTEKVRGIQRIAIDALVVASRSAKTTPIYRAHLLEQAVQRLKKIEGTAEERKLLLLERSESQKQMLAQMHTHHHEVDMTERIAQLYRAMESLGKDECLCFLARLFPLFDPCKMADGVATKAESSLAVFFETKIMDAAGRTSATIPALVSNDNEDAVEAHSIHDTLLLMDIYGFCIAHILNYIKNRFELDLDDARRIVDHSAFVMPSRSKLFETGINAGFQEDFITAINILVPQVENSVRCLLQDSGAIVYNLKDDGTEEVKTLHALLDLPEAADIFEADLLFTLKAVFCSKFGLNLRNDNAHGLLSDGFFFSRRAYYGWWLVFRLCYMLNGRELWRNYSAVTGHLEDAWSEPGVQNCEDDESDP